MKDANLREEKPNDSIKREMKLRDFKQKSMILNSKLAKHLKICKKALRKVKKLNRY